MNKKPWIAAVLNFFLAGPGYIYNGRRRLFRLALTIGAIALTYVELNLQSSAPHLYPIMFGAVFLLNTFFAVDGWLEARAVNRDEALAYL